ncbi:MAG: hypothetical protein QOG59_1977, partial [Solirubrobacteraceae bacterium]|nr:hypothetical protein [Solirubrobacteraceae bacterium]
MKPPTRSRSVRFALAAASAMIALIGSFSAPAVAAPSTPAPTLAALPDVLWQGAAKRAPLTLALPASASGTALRAAILAAGAAQRAAGVHGLSVRVLLAPTAAQLAAAPGSEIVIDERPGTSSLALTPESRGRVRLTVAGAGDGLLSAARLLSVPAIRAFTTRSASVPTGLATPVTHNPAPTSVAVRAGSVTGRGTLSLNTQFTLPLDRQLAGDSVLQIVAGYDSPAGGRISVRLQGGVLGATNVPANGPLRTALDAKLSSDPALTGDTLPGWWAHPGVNQLTLTASPKRAGAPGTLQVLPNSRVAVATRPRAATLQLGLWPFPIYNDHAWSQATVVLGAQPDARTLSALIGALANTERITGVTPDPH